MNYCVRGANRDSGQAVEIYVEATSEVEATKVAGRTGMIVSEVRFIAPLRSARPVDAPLGPMQSKRIVAGVTALVAGGFGLHKFVLGNHSTGLIFLLATICTCFAAAPVFAGIGIYEGIVYLMMTDEQFIATYQIGRREWF